MDIIIPEQLKKIDYRFCPLIKGTKRSYTSHDKQNYSYKDKHFLDLLNLGYNYGVLTGYNNLLVIDVDSNIILKEIQELNLPQTFTTLSATKKKPHFYYKTISPKKTFRFNGLDLLGKGSYAVGSSCLIENNNTILKYIITNDFPIAFLSEENYNKILSIAQKYKKTKQKPNVKIKDKPFESYYLDKKEFVEKPTDFIIEDVIRYTKNGRYENKVSSLDNRYINKTFDFNVIQMLNFLKMALPKLILTLKSEEYTDKKTGKKYLRWIPLNVKG